MAATITAETVLDAILRSDDAALDTEPATYHNPDFRTHPPTIGFDDGTPLLLTDCEQYIGDRWEGFVSMQRIPQAIRAELGI